MRRGLEYGHQQRRFGLCGGKAMKRNGKLLHIDWNVAKSVALESRDYVLKKSGLKLPPI